METGAEAAQDARSGSPGAHPAVPCLNEHYTTTQQQQSPQSQILHQLRQGSQRVGKYGEQDDRDGKRKHVVAIVHRDGQADFRGDGNEERGGWYRNHPPGGQRYQGEPAACGGEKGEGGIRSERDAGHWNAISLPKHSQVGRVFLYAAGG